MKASISAYSILLLSWGVISQLPCAYAFFLMPAGQVAIEQKDPIVSPGQNSSKHVHVIAGSRGFSEHADFEKLTKQGECTSAAVRQDMSAYWAPMLYYKTKIDGKEVVKAVKNADINVYYKFVKNNSPGSKHTYYPFPDIFQMRAGKADARKLDDLDGHRKVAKWRCLGNDPTATFEMPNRPCPHGLRADISFPNCWNGQSGAEASVTYPEGFNEQGDNDEEAECPSDHPKMLPRLFLEVWFSNTDIVWNPSEQKPFFLANGDQSGAGFHADFMNGWKDKALENALNTCVGSPSGEIEACFPGVGSDPNRACNRKPDDSLVGWETALTKLPGDNPITPRTKRSLPRRIEEVDEGK
ncbi:hypothetical protein P389DRAFT_91188 [Cystobasidium minutum MCA 4210]|uniref:uncharacterized protein n=1 Tax=Cystobasidium minutum MCA 4210 TaxID=1397322 RepID=UPI0034CE7783|eukprot:jgi/Rhomi1/91188/CE91187_108